MIESSRFLCWSLKFYDISVSFCDWYISCYILCPFFLQVHNVNFAFELMQDAGLAKPKARPEGINPVSYALQYFTSEGVGQARWRVEILFMENDYFHFPDQFDILYHDMFYGKMKFICF